MLEATWNEQSATVNIKGFVSSIESGSSINSNETMIGTLIKDVVTAIKA